MGSGTQKRQRALAIRAYHLRQDGMTHRQIAELVGKDVKQVAALILVGARFADDALALSVKTGAADAPRG